MSKKWSYKPNLTPFDDSFNSEEGKIRQDISIQYEAFKLMELIHMASISDNEDAVLRGLRQFLSILPPESRKRIWEKRKEYIKEEDVWVYKKYCGQPIGTPSNPVLDDDGIPISPNLEHQKTWDNNILYDVIQEEALILGLTWKTLPYGIIASSDDDDPNIPPPNPKKAIKHTVA